MTLQVLLPEGWPRPSGYANGMMGTGTFVIVSGQIGWDSEGRVADGLVAQTRQVLLNIRAVLTEAKAGPEHVARMTWYVTDLNAFRDSTKELGLVWREMMGKHYPAMAVVGVTGLVDAKACIEIETTAIIP